MSRSLRRQLPWHHAQIETCEARELMTADPLYDFHIENMVDEQPLLNYQVDAFSTPTMSAISATAAAYGFVGAGQTVAVIDSGIAWDHPALGGGFGTSYRVVGGWDFTEENDAVPYDDAPGGSHGTHVAGIIGSSNSTSPGVAPGVDLVALRVFNDQGSGSFSWVENALRWVHQNRNSFENPITTVNLSLGATWNSNSIPSWAMLEDEFAQLEADGIFISVAAGNAFSQYNTTGLSYPAASSYVIPVASVDAGGGLSSFSQRNDRVIAAPGRSIRSTVPDYVGNVNGRPDDFATYSGTSMAAPFVAGASVLIREAMESVGRQNINQDMIYDVMRQTADWVWDPATSRSYARLNLENALTTVLTTDDFGSTAGAAYNLGTVTTTTAIAGAIGQSSDADFFRFTAGQSGTATFTIANSGAFQTNWQLVGGGGAANGNTFTFSVTAGASYTIGLSSTGGTGNYSLSGQIERVTTNLGTVDFLVRENQSVVGESWYTVTASRAGTLSVEALFAQAGGNIDLEIYKGATKIATSAKPSGNERVDVNANAGEVFYVRARGANADVDLRITNLVSRVGSVVNVAGTSGADTFVLKGGSTHQVTINGVVYSFAGKQVNQVNFNGGGGADSANITGTTAAETATLRPGSVELVGTKFRASGTNVETVVVNGGGGADKAKMYDSAGDDTFSATPTMATLVGAGYSNRVERFVRVEAIGSLGDDIADLLDSVGNDTFLASPTSAALYGKNFYNLVQAFDEVNARSVTGGRDTAIFSDSAGDDTFIANPTLAMMYGSSYFNSAAHFEKVQAKSTGGYDTATLGDSNGSDKLTVKRDIATMAGANYSNQVQGFDKVTGEGSSGANTLKRNAADFVFDWIGNWS